MQLHTIRGGNIEDLNNKKYTIGVGISLGNKWFTVENIVSLVEWCLEHTKDNVIVYVADSIHAINLEVRNRISFDKAERLADQMGTDILNNVKAQLEKELSAEDNKKIIYVKWQSIVDDSYKNKLGYIQSLYQNNTEFKNTIETIVRGLTSKEVKTFTDQEITRLGEYIVAEIPEVINRVKMAGSICDAYVYPYDGELTRLIEKIQKGEVFPEIKENIMDTEPKVFLEVR